MKQYEYLVGLALALLAVGSVYAAEIRVSVDRNPVNLNESFQLIFNAETPPDGQPDFSPLQQDFQILNQQHSSNVSWVNGQSSRSERWLVSVMAKHGGLLNVPPVAFGRDSSMPLVISVSDKPQSIDRNEEVFMQVETTPEAPYVQSQVLYTLRIYFRVQISQSSLSALEVKNALVEQLGEDSAYRTQLNGVEYGVLERKYAIFPQQSGELTIEPLVLTTEVPVERQPRFNGFFNRPVTETRRLSSKAVQLNVLPVPKNFTGSAWLSAESLTLTDSWDGGSLQGKVGEPLTRTVALSAKGTTVGQLPELLPQADDAGLKTYPDQPRLQEDKQGDGLLAQREEKVAYIPSRPGQYTLPAVVVDWFDTQTGTMKRATLPPVTLNVAAAGGQAPQNEAVAVPPVETPAGERLNGEKGYFWPALAAFLAFGWLFSVIWLLRNSAKTVTKTETRQAKDDAGDSVKALQAACARHDAQAAKQALLVWGKSAFGAENLADLATACPTPLAEEIRVLNEHLYAGATDTWNGQVLAKVFTAGRRQKQAEPEAAEALEPLYKIR